MNQSPRFSSFSTPHKGIRNFLSQLSLHAGSCDYSDPQDIAVLKERLEEAMELLEEHAQVENDIILSALEERAPGSGAHDQEDHRRLHQMQDILLAKMHEIANPATRPGETARLGAELYQGISLLFAEHLEHMAEEENVTQKLLWDHFSDHELMQLQGRIIGSMKPELLLKWWSYILPAQSPMERLKLMANVQASAPPAFFEQIMAVAQKNLPEQAFSKLAASLAPEEAEA